MPGFLTPQQGGDCCCNGVIGNCKCVAELTECLFTWECSTPRDELNIPRDSPHLIRLIRQESTDPEETVFETALSSGSWIPPETHAISTLYRIDVCCIDPGDGECNWKSIGSITLSETATCEDCTDRTFNFPCLGVAVEGELPTPTQIVVAINGDTYTCPDCADPSTDWSGVYSFDLEIPIFIPTDCSGSLTVLGDTRTCDGFTIQDELNISAGHEIGVGFVVRVRFRAITGGIPAGGSTTITYLMDEPFSQMLTPGFTDCDGLVLGNSANQTFSYVSRSTSGSGTICDWSTYNPVVSAELQPQ